MKDLTKNKVPYVLLKPKHQKRLCKAEEAGQKIETYDWGAEKFIEKILTFGGFSSGGIYRIAPTPKPKPFNLSKEQWAHYDDSLICAAFDRNNSFHLYRHEPKEGIHAWKISDGTYARVMGVKGVPAQSPVPWDQSLVWRKDAV